MALLTEEVESQVRAWIEAFFASLAAVTFGGTAGLGTVRFLTAGRAAAGAVEDVGGAVASFQQAFMAGKVAGVLGTNQVRKMSVAQLRGAIEGTPIATLTEADAEVLSLLNRNSARTIARRFAAHQAEVEEALSVANTRWTGALQSGLSPIEQAATRRSLLVEVSEQLGFQLAGAGSDVKRFMQTELSTYFQRGEVQGAPEDEIVWKIPRPNAERQCMRLHLSGDGSPRRWNLSDVIGNSNLGLPPEQWVFTIGPVHPFCYCILFRESLERRPGPNKRLADRREETLTQGRVIPTGPRSQAARRGRSTLPRGTRSAVRIGDRVVPLGSPLDPSPVRRALARAGGRPPAGGRIAQKFETISQRLERRLAGRPKAKQVTDDLDELYRAAAAADPVLQRAVEDLAEALGGDAVFPPGLKNRARVLEKAAAKYGGDLAAITDISRASLQFDKLEQVYDALAQLEARGLKIVRLNDRFLRPTAEGYRDIILNVQMPNGHVAELQLHVRGILDAKEKTHILYERQRSLVAQAKKQARDLTAAETRKLNGLVEQQQRAYDRAFDEARKAA